MNLYKIVLKRTNIVKCADTEEFTTFGYELAGSRFVVASDIQEATEKYWAQTPICSKLDIHSVYQVEKDEVHPLVVIIK